MDTFPPSFAEYLAARELAPLQSIKDQYPKTILSLDEIATRDYDGIRHLDLVEWLLAID
jgi:predicted AAA+ superfamily ATPase